MLLQVVVLLEWYGKGVTDMEGLPKVIAGFVVMSLGSPPPGLRWWGKGLMRPASFLSLQGVAGKMAGGSVAGIYPAHHPCDSKVYE